MSTRETESKPSTDGLKEVKNELRLGWIRVTTAAVASMAVIALSGVLSSKLEAAALTVDWISAVLALLAALLNTVALTRKFNVLERERDLQEEERKHLGASVVFMNDVTIATDDEDLVRRRSAREPTDANEPSKEGN